MHAHKNLTRAQVTGTALRFGKIFCQANPETQMLQGKAVNALDVNLDATQLALSVSPRFMAVV